MNAQIQLTSAQKVSLVHNRHMIPLGNINVDNVNYVICSELGKDAHTLQRFGPYLLGEDGKWVDFEKAVLMFENQHHLNVVRVADTITVFAVHSGCFTEGTVISVDRFEDGLVRIQLVSAEGGLYGYTFPDDGYISCNKTV